MSEKNIPENEDPSWSMHMQMLMRKKRNMEIAPTIDDALSEWYSEQGRPVPWTEYLKQLGIDPHNP